MAYEKQGLLHEMFIRQARKTPDRTALLSVDGRIVTFGELDQWSDTLALCLRIRGLVPDRCVGIFMEKTIEFVIAYIAILKAGGAYLPIDTSYPPHLLESILEDAKPVAIAVSPELAKKLDGIPNVIVMKEGWQTKLTEENSSHPDPGPPPKVTLDNLAYIVYSSGTTGKPKGIMCPHRGAVFSYHWRHTQYPYTHGDREACNIFFVWEMLRPLLQGIPMYIIPNFVIYDPPLLCHFIGNNQITRILFTPSLLETILNSSDIDFQQSLKSLRQIWFCGEVVTTALLGKCVKLLPWVQLINLYSVSECHDTACEDLTAYYLNHKIYVGGPTLARGYVNRPEIQAKRFITRPDQVPVTYGDRLYRTGDWGYVLSDGSLEICGRCDSMVKIRGYSIEIQAVESALMSLPMVHACLVIVSGEEGDDKFLVSYIVPEGQTTKKEIRAALKRRLPFYMIPSFFVFMQSIPVMTASGKLDKSALPPFDKDLADGVEIEGKPTTETEVTLVEIWAKVLQIRNIDIQESFFDLGGHSLLATELLNKVREKFSINITVKELFSYPTVSSLGRLIESKVNNVTENCRASPRPVLDLKAEVEKHDQGVVNLDIQLRAFWRTFHHGHHFHKGRVLLTGATGFLGAFLLKELVLHTKLLVYCLVRELPQVKVMDRIRQSLSQFGIIPNAAGKGTEEQRLMEQQLTKRVTVVKGNVALMNLGMTEDDYTYLCTDIDFIIHAAAAVNLAYPYSALHGPNVLGSANIVLFACTGKVKPIHYISTDAVFPNGMKDCSEDDDASSYHDKLTDGYAQSKWVAEQLVSKAGQRGVPITVYRLGNMAGDRENAFWNPQDFTLLVLQACAKYGVAPDVDWDMEMTPVDFAAHVVVRLTQNPPLTLRKTFHIINNKPLKARMVFEWMNTHGYPLQILPFCDWRKRVLLETESTSGSGQRPDLLSHLLESYIKDESFLSNLSTYKNNNLLDALSQLKLDYSYITTELLKLYFDRLTARRVISPKLRLISAGSRPLDGKVAIVTGASSGIGAAIAAALAQAGAKVAMAARREEQLHNLEKTIKEKGGAAISVKTDVLNREQVRELVQHTEETLGPVDILVNNAGVMYYTLMKNAHLDEWDKQIDVNCKGVTNCIGGVLEGMMKRSCGHIVNISSDAGRKGFPGLAVYSGTKHFVEGMSQALRHEIKGSGVKVTCIQPGDVKTELFAYTTDEEARAAYDVSSTSKILEAEDIARAVVYAVTQPDNVAVNEILVQPREAPL